MLPQAIAASWFETRGTAALLTMRVLDLILRRRESAVSKDVPRNDSLSKYAFAFSRRDAPEVCIFHWRP
jgi:hypothetical protein